MGLCSWLLANAYDSAMHKYEQRCLGQWRADLLAGARGELLEIGAGTGINLPHYPDQVDHLIVSEPDPQMHKQLLKRISSLPKSLTRATNWSAEQIDLPDQSIDTIVSTLVLCSVNNLQQSLRELHRVLRPGGQLLFLEHVVATEDKTQRWQKICQPLWKCCCGNCHLTRDTASNIEAVGLTIEKLCAADIPGAPSIVRRTIRGCARKTVTTKPPKLQEI